MSIVIKKHHKSIPNSINQSNHLLTFGNFGIKSLFFMKISDHQLKTIEWLILQETKFVTGKKSIKFWCFIHLNKNLTKLNLESRMGKGKGNFYSKVCFIKPGKILFEFDKISYVNMLKLFDRIKNQFPGKIILVC
uniref:Ribosomal protein L16 n=1 Tax=Gastroclonium compressum TaxID=1852973 RepID=A0A173FZP8_GASCM|nr:ribosomal protein L16 [Coeloseira compressa]